MNYDIYFCRYEDTLYAVTAEPGEPPMDVPREVRSVSRTLKKLRMAGHTISQVGILSPEMIGLDVEV